MYGQMVCCKGTARVEAEPAKPEYAAAQQAAVLAPKLGLCGGLLAAILLWPAG